MAAKAQAERPLAVGIRPEFVVDRGDGEPWFPASFSTGWRRFTKGRGFEGVTFHTFRHGAATLMLAAGVSDAVAISVMGHADTRILRRYQDVVNDLKRDGQHGWTRSRRAVPFLVEELSDPNSDLPDRDREQGPSEPRS